MIKEKELQSNGYLEKFSLDKFHHYKWKRLYGKVVKFFVVHVITNKDMDKEDKLKFDDIPILQELLDVFPKEIPGLTPERTWFYYWVTTRSCT